MTVLHALREVTEWDGLIEKIGKLTDTGSMFDITVSPLSETMKQFGNTLSAITKPMEVVIRLPQRQRYENNLTNSAKIFCI